MAASDDGIFTSHIHTFLVGEKKRAITVHSRAIAKQSKGLDVLINGKMIEAANSQTVLEDVLEDTFIRFCQYSYMGDYEAPDSTSHLGTDASKCLGSVKSSKSSAVIGNTSKAATYQGKDFSRRDMGWGFPVVEEPAIEKPPDEAQNYWIGTGVKPKKRKECLSKSSLLRQEFDNICYDINDSAAASNDRFRIRENELSQEDYTPVFLGHARLYVFAKKWGVDALKNLTLFKLHKTLSAFKIYEARRKDVAELVKFAYSTENTPDLGDGVDALRNLVTHYVACEIESLIESPDLVDLLERPGSFSRDLVMMMMKRFD